MKQNFVSTKIRLLFKDWRKLWICGVYVIADLDMAIGCTIQDRLVLVWFWI